MNISSTITSIITKYLSDPSIPGVYNSADVKDRLLSNSFSRNNAVNIAGKNRDYSLTFTLNAPVNIYNINCILWYAWNTTNGASKQWNNTIAEYYTSADVLAYSRAVVDGSTFNRKDNMPQLTKFPNFDGSFGGTLVPTGAVNYSDMASYVAISGGNIDISENNITEPITLGSGGSSMINMHAYINSIIESNPIEISDEEVTEMYLNADISHDSISSEEGKSLREEIRYLLQYQHVISQLND